MAVMVFLATLLAGNGMAEFRPTLDVAPARIALDGNGDLLVSDYTYGQVLTVAPDTLDIIGEFDVNGRPMGIAWANDLIYVGNTTTGQVEVYDSTGTEQFVLGQGGYPIEMPQDLAVGNGNVYVVDGSDRIVKIFAQDGGFVGTIPAAGYDPDLLANPTAIAVDETTQRIYVSDYGDLGNSANPVAPRIQVFNIDGSLAYSIISGSPGDYHFAMPQGLTVSGNNYLFVIDSLTGKILVYDGATGELVQKLKKTGKQKGEFGMKMPLDILIDSATDNVFVTNTKLASILVFTGAGGI